MGLDRDNTDKQEAMNYPHVAFPLNRKYIIL